MVRLFTALDALGVAEYVQFDPNVMRGLLYYTGTVFEAFDLTGGVRRAILGGGRYDNLLSAVGGDPLPAVGFAMGDVVIGIVLEEKGLLPSFELTPAPVLVTVFDEERFTASQKLAADLRRGGLNVACYPEAVKLPRQFKYADRIGAKVVLVLGPEEAESGRVTVKNLLNGEQAAVPREAIVSAVLRLLETQSG
jgi:histidyl-tRNA synthetase